MQKTHTHRNLERKKFVHLGKYGSLFVKKIVRIKSADLKSRHRPKSNKSWNL